MKPDIEKLRKKYINNPPEGMTSADIRHMSEEELLDMDYFLNEDIFDDEFAEEGFFLFWFMIIVLSCPPSRGLF